MNKIKCIKIVIIFKLFSAMLVCAEINRSFAIAAIKKFEFDKNTNDFLDNFNKILYDQVIDTELKFELFVPILFAAAKYIEANPKPEGLAIASRIPDDYYPYLDEDTAREKIKIANEANDALLAKIDKYNDLLKIKNHILNLFSFHKRSNSGSDLIDKCIKKYTNDPLVIEKITDLINREIENDKNRSR